MPIVVTSSSNPDPGDGSVTALDIINRAAELIGYKDVDESLTATEKSNFLGVLNSIVDTWNSQRLYITQVEETATNVSSSPVTIGTSMTINVPRPVVIEAGSFIRSSGTDYPLKWMTREEYNAIADKSSTSSIPTHAYYNRDIPTGYIYLYPVPSTTVALHLQLRTMLSEFADTSTSYSLAPGFKKALVYTLAEELAPGRRPLDPQIARIAANSRRVIKRANHVIAPLNSSSPVLSNVGRILSGL